MKRIISILIIFSLFSGIFAVYTSAAMYEYNTDKVVPTLVLEDQFGMFEAEDMYIKGDYKVVEAEGASGGKYLIPQNETVLDVAELRKKTGGADHAQLYIEVKEEAYYTIWIRSFYLRNTVNGNYFVNLDGETVQRHFDNCSDYEWNSAWTTKLTPGRHYIGLCPRRSNVAVDKILITSSEYYVPSDTGAKPAPFVLGKEGERKSGLFFPLPAYTPPSEHPRLYLRNSDIPKIKENLTHPQNMAAWNKVQELANSDKNCTVNSNATYSFDETVHIYVEVCAFMYAIDKENNIEYGKKAVNGLYEYLNSISYSGDSLSLARSGIIQYIAKVYDWCYDLLSDEMKEFFIKKGLALMSKLETGWPPVKLSAFNSDHGSEGGIQVDSMSLAIATYGDYSDIWDAVAGRFFSEYIAINNFYYNQSWWQAEGDSYGHSRYTYEAKANSILDKLGLGGLVSKNERFLSYNMIYRRRPDGNFMMDGDIWDITFQNSSPSCYKGSAGSLLSASYRYDDPYLKYELYKMFANGLQASGRDGSYSLVDFLILNDVNVGLKSNEELPLTAYTGEGHNMMTVRTGWDDGIESNTMVVSLKGGGRTRGGHMHCDAGNFTIYYKGPLAIDSGVYNGLPFVDENGNDVTNVKAGSYHFANYQQRTIAHNCILVYDPDENMTYHNLGELNDGGQLKVTKRITDTGQTTYQAATDDSKIIATRLGVDYGPDMNKPSYSYLKTDITNAYSYKVKEYHRTFMFQNFFDEVYPGALIVMDKVTSSDPNFKKTWLLHSQEEPVVDGQMTTIKRTEYGYNGVLVNESLLPKVDNSVTEKIGGEGKEYWVGDKNVKAVTITKGDESGKWRIEISPRTAKDTDYFLNVLHVYENDKDITPLKSELYDSERYAGIKIKDRVTYLSKTGNKTSSDVFVYADGNENKLLWTVDGLNKGRWNIADENGKVITFADVTEEGGVAYFEAKPGAYAVTKAIEYVEVPSKDFNILNATSEDDVDLNIKLAVNTMYQYIDRDDPILEENGKIYIPAKRLLEILDSQSAISDNGDSVMVNFEDNTYVFNLKENTVVKKVMFSELEETITLSESLVRIDNKLYLPLNMLTELFDKTYEYDRIGKIVRIKNTFMRASDFIINSNDKGRIAVSATSDTDMALNSKAYHALDGDMGSNASINTIGGTMVFKFKDVEDLKKVSIAWNSPTARDYYYEFHISEDGINYTKLSEGQTGFGRDWMEYQFDSVKAKYFKIVAKGNTLNDWFVIKEIRFYNEI